MRPMLASPTDRVPSGSDWAHEVKWDGMRALVDSSGGRVRVFSRTERDVGVAFPELLAADSRLADHDDLLIDGEIVVLKGGRPSFAALAARFHVADPAYAASLAASAPVTLIAFDLLRLFGRDLTARPWQERRDLLEAASLASPWVQVPPVFDDGAELFEATHAQGLEGIVAKKRSAPYRPGVRSEDWRKLVHRRADSFVIVGWRPMTTGSGLGAVLLGTPTPAGVIYRGRIGSGLAGQAGRALLARLREHERPNSPLLEAAPRQDTVGCTWVDPVLVADIEHLGLSEGGRLRQPSWRGLRADLSPADLMSTDTASEDITGDVVASEHQEDGNA